MSAKVQSLIGTFTLFIAPLGGKSEIEAYD